jgi:hypothetical protein
MASRLTLYKKFLSHAKRNPSVIYCALVGSLVFAFHQANADTLYLNTNVPVHGKVLENKDGLLKVQTGDRIVWFRQEEVQRIESNNLTGKIDLDAVRREWEETDRGLTQRFGLSHAQRQQVDELIYKLQREEERFTARERLVALQQEVDIFPYCLFRYEEVSHRIAPWLLETLLKLDPTRALPTVIAALENSYFGTRAMAIALLASMNHTPALEKITAGLKDHNVEVRVTAIYALAQMRVRRATPALIDLLQDPDLRVNNAAKEALAALWQQEIGATRPTTVAEWSALWEKHKNTAEPPIQLAEIKPLIMPEEEFQDE